MTFLKTEKNVFISAVFISSIIAAGNFIAYKIVHIPARLELVIIMTVILFYPILRYPLLGVYLMFGLMPFVPFIRRQYYLLHLRPSVDPLIAIGDILIALTLIGLYFIFRQGSEEDKNKKTIGRIVFVYFIYCMIRTFLINILPFREAIMQFHFFGPPVLFFYIGLLYAEKTDILNRLWIITIIIGAAAAVYGIKQLVIGYSEAEKIWFSSISFTTLFIKGFARPFSFFQSPACFADYMLLSIIGIFIIICRKKSNFRFLLLMLLPLFFYAALITSVRSNWIGVILAPLLWLFMMQIRGNRNRILMVVVLFLLFAFIQFTEYFFQYKVGINFFLSALGKGFSNERLSLLVTERIGAIANPFKEYSLLSRIALWKHMIALSIDPINALFGRGVGTINTDSLYINYLVQFGYPGAVFIVWLVTILIIKGFKALDSSLSSEKEALVKGVTLMNIIFAIINLTGTHINSFPGDVYFWFWNGVLVKLSAGIDNNNSFLSCTISDNRE